MPVSPGYQGLYPAFVGVGIGRVVRTAMMPMLVAPQAGRDDIFGGVSTAILHGDQMFLRAFQIGGTFDGKLVAACKFFTFFDPHGKAAIETFAVLLLEGLET